MRGARARSVGAPSTAARAAGAALAAMLALVAAVVAAPTTAGAQARSIEEACPPDRTPPSFFLDTYGNAHEASIDCIVWYEITTGVGSNEYRPAQPVRRDQMATFMVRTLEALGVELPEARDQGFEDLDGTVHEPSINRLAAAGVVGGTAPGRYSPARLVRRDQMATFLVRSYELAVATPLAAAQAPFADTAGNAHEANIAKAAGAGFTDGTGAERYSPARSVQRDQMASFIARMLAAARPEVPGGRNHPHPLGTTVVLADGWELTVLSSTPDATDEVVTSNPLNAPPAEGNQFFMARVRASYAGEGAARFDGGYRLRALGDSGRTYTTFDDGCGAIADPLPNGEVHTGGTMEGNVCWEVAAADAHALRLFDVPIQDDYRARVFLALRDAAT